MLPALTGDRHDFRVVNDFARSTSWLHGVATFFAKDAVFLFVPLLLVGWYLGRRARSPRLVAIAAWGAIGAVVALLIGKVISSAADEQRPFVAMHHVLLLVAHGADAGFPSDHATAAGAVAAALVFIDRRLGAVAVLLAVLIAFSRVYVGVHFPQDVAAGLALGAAVAVIGVFLVVPLLTRLAEGLTRTPLRPLIVA